MITQEKSSIPFQVHPVSRREFIFNSMAVLGTSSILLMPSEGAAENPGKKYPVLTVQQVIDLILKDIPGAPFKETVDTLKSGSPDQAVTGIVTTMFATVSVIQKAIELKANFIIAHEPTFYNHLDETSWLSQDTVYRFKSELLQRNSIAIWRFHDHWHSALPDGVLAGFLKVLGWDSYYNPGNPRMITLPPTSLAGIISHLKEKLGIVRLRTMGDLAQMCQRIALLPGAAGGRRQIQLLQKEQPDVLICGEIQEWETSEYIRDARAMGSKISLVVLGHALSEEPGMQALVDWLNPKVPGINITHIPSGDPFTWS